MCAAGVQTKKLEEQLAVMITPEELEEVVSVRGQALKDSTMGCTFMDTKGDFPMTHTASGESSAIRV